MNYQDWLSCIENLLKKDDEIIKNKLLSEPYNDNLSPLLEPKLIELIKHKFEYATKNIIDNIYEIFNDNYILDMYLVTLKKNMQFIKELTYIKTISNENQEKLRSLLNEETNKIYTILINKANQEDPIGILSLTIKNNKFEWSDKNEL